MTPTRRNSAAVRISSPGLSHAEVTRILELTPTIAHRAGKSRGRGLTWSHDLWHYDIPGSRSRGEPLEVVIRALLDALEPFKSRLQRIAERDTPLLWCACVGSGPEVSVELSRAILDRIAEFSMGISISNYTHSD